MLISLSGLLTSLLGLNLLARYALVLVFLGKQDCWMDAKLLLIGTLLTFSDKQLPLLIFTYAGISAGIDMALHIVSYFFGTKVGEATAHQMVYPYPQILILKTTNVVEIYNRTVYVI